MEYNLNTIFNYTIKNNFKLISDGVRGGIRTHDPRIHTTSTFAAGQSYDRLWSGLSLHHRENPLGAARPVSTPSLQKAWLGIGI